MSSWLRPAALLVVLVSTALPSRAADEPAELPQPLTLESALQHASDAHPELLLSRARLAEHSALAARAEAADDLEGRLYLRSRQVDPATEVKALADHQLDVSLTKRLYDFGLSDSRIEAARRQQQSSEHLLTGDRFRHRLAVMARFFDVLLADLRYARDNEAMAIAFVRFERLQDRHDLRQVSDVELLKSENDYQASLRRRTASANAQRLTRAGLALALGRPGSLPDELLEPELRGNGRELPDVDNLTAVAMRDNARLAGLRAAVQAAHGRISQARQAFGPVVNGELGAGASSRKLSGRESWRAGLVLEMPLLTGSRADAEVGLRRAEWLRAQAELKQAEYEIGQAVLENWLAIDTLRAQRHEALVQGDYRDLELERSRALYELEVHANLGDAMVETSRARLLEAETEYELALAWARLEALLGRMPGIAGAALLEEKP